MSQDEMEKVSLRLFYGDKEKLGQLFPQIGYNKAVRILVRNFIKSVESKAAESSTHISDEVKVNLKESIDNDK